MTQTPWRADQSELRLARRALWAASLVLPLLVLRHTATRAATDLVAARPNVWTLDDPVTNATVMARWWARWDAGEFGAVDERVFAPVPNALALGENFFIPSLIGYPFSRLSGSIPIGINVPYYLALVVFPVALYGVLARIAGGGFASAGLALLAAWGPGRMNTLGVLTGLFTAFALVAACAALDFLRTGRWRHLAVLSAAILVQALSSLYGLALGALWLGAAILLVRRPRIPRLLALAGAGAVAIAASLPVLLPYLRLRQDFGSVTSLATYEQHAADVLSLVHGGLFGGPVAALLRSIAPGFPVGAAAFFPTLAFGGCLLLYSLSSDSRRLEGPGVAPWVLLAIGTFVLALGPVIRVAGHPIIPGPFRLLSGVPGFSALRGIHRFDQWFDVSLAVAAAIAVSRLRGARRLPRFAGVSLVALGLLDFWPADVPTFEFPRPDAAAVAAARSLPPDATVARLPFDRASAVSSWVDQLAHGRRVVNGFLSFSPPIHSWLAPRLPRMPVPTRIAVLRELGASLVQVDLGAVSPQERVLFEELAHPLPELGIVGASRTPGSLFLFLEPRRPILLSDATLSGLRFHRDAAFLAFPQGRIAFRVGGPSRNVLVEGRARRRDTLSIPVVSTSPVRLTLTVPLEKGAIVRDAETGLVIGKEGS